MYDVPVLAVTKRFLAFIVELISCSVNTFRR